MKKKYCYVLIIGSGLISLSIFFTLVIISFANCKTPPLIDLIHPKYKNSSYTCIVIKGVHFEDKTKSRPWHFLTNNNGWDTNHYINNFMITLFISSWILVSKKHVRKMGLKYYFCVVAITVMKGALGEIIEAIINVTASTFKYVKISETPILWWENTIDWLSAYWSETVGDIILSDVLQCFLAALLAVLYMYVGILKPMGILLRFKKWYIITIRSIIYSLFLLSSFLIVAKKRYIGWNYDIPVGYFGYMFLQWFFLTLLWVEDRISSNKTKKISEKEVDWFYTFLAIFMFTMWGSMAGLLSPGLITSNIASVGLFLMVFVCYVTIYSNWTKIVKKQRIFTLDI